ncbi:MAG: hypothetical protein K8E24_007870 [Methanobacterium paludis]|nr:hypothetical protein [Methanobacterium paludis]
MQDKMPDEFYDYLDDLDMTNVVIKKIRIIYKNLQELFPELKIDLLKHISKSNVNPIPIKRLIFLEVGMKH